MSRARVGASLQHEVGTHLVTYYNGLEQPLRLLHVGLAGYDETQEGLAVLAEYLVGGLSRSRLRTLAERVRPRLVQDGMFLVGLDIVGDKLMEINVFYPGGLNAAQRLEGVHFCRAVIESLERKVEYVRHHHHHFDNVEIAVY